jgi:hypothetical protein
MKGFFKDVVDCLKRVTLIECLIVLMLCIVLLATIIPMYYDYKQKKCEHFETGKCYYEKNVNPFTMSERICVLEKKGKFIKVKKYFVEEKQYESSLKETIESGECINYREYKEKEK